jgi:hypothetical protein
VRGEEAAAVCGEKAATSCEEEVASRVPSTSLSGG